MRIDILTYPWSTFAWYKQGILGDGDVRFYDYDAHISYNYLTGWFVQLTKYRNGEVERCEYRPKNKKDLEELLGDLREEAKSTFEL